MHFLECEPFRDRGNEEKRIWIAISIMRLYPAFNGLGILLGGPGATQSCQVMTENHQTSASRYSQEVQLPDHNQDHK
jgi:hypothetical protein